MGRTDEVQFMQECIVEWRRLGARVTLEPGWESRGNGSQANYEGGIVHHTASNSSATTPNPTRSVLVNGRSDLPGPLCNVTGPWCADNDPWLHVIAAYPANHAGASGGKSMGPLPVTGSFNTRVVGLEIDYSGTAPMTAGQRRAALIFTRGLINVLKVSTEYVRAHAETSVTGKWDPGYAPGKTIDMAAFRRDAAAYTLTATAPQEDDDMARYPLYLQATDRPPLLVWPGFTRTINTPEERDRAIALFGDWTSMSTRDYDVTAALHTQVDMSAQAINAITAQVAKGGARTDVEALAETVLAGLLPRVAAAVGTAGKSAEVTSTEIKAAAKAGLIEVLTSGTGA